jgi:thioesterase domain-containing protein
MTDARTDQIAREAARLIETGKARTVGEAIRLAADALHLQAAPMPGHGRVRKHAQGMAMQAMGERAYRRSIDDVLNIAEQLLTAIEQTEPEGPAVLVGRAAKGQVDAGVTLHLRVYTRRPMREIVERLVAFGYEEPSFETADTRFGRLDRVRFSEAGCEVALTRCLPEMAAHMDRDLFTRRPIAVATAQELRRRLSGGVS